MSVDYRNLLKQYMNHVGMMEGVDFLGERYSFPKDPEERAAIMQLRKELEEEYRAAHPRQ